MNVSFYLLFAIALWLLMAIGFSDNWLFDRAQESNSQPKFLIHAFFAFCWFTLLVIQSGLIRVGNYGLHMRLGIIAIFVYVCMTATIWYLYVSSYLESGDIFKLVRPLEILSVLLVAIGFVNRRRNSQKHRECLLFGTFCLIGPALDRTVFHLFGPDQMFYPMMILYIALFCCFLWSVKKLTWYMTLWMVFLVYSLFPLIERQFQTSGAL